MEVILSLVWLFPCFGSLATLAVISVTLCDQYFYLWSLFFKILDSNDYIITSDIKAISECSSKNTMSSRYGWIKEPLFQVVRISKHTYRLLANSFLKLSTFEDLLYVCRTYTASMLPNVLGCIVYGSIKETWMMF